MDFTGIGAEKNSFFLDTKGLCFMCLKENGTNGRDEKFKEEFDGDNEPSSIFSQSNAPRRLFSFQTLSRYLKMSFQQVFNTSVPLRSTGVLEQSDILVSLCGGCVEVAESFTNLHHELELIQMKLTSCIQVIRERVVDGEGNCWQLGRSDQIDSLQSEIIMNLRRETIEKCLIHVQRALPRVKVNKLEDSDIPTSSPISIEAMNTDTANEDLYSYEEEPMEEPVEAESTPSCSNTQVVGPRGNKVTYCDLCKKYVRSLIQHNRSAHRKKIMMPYKCQWCEKCFANSHNIRMHNIVHHYEQNFIALKEPILSNELFKAAVDLQLLGGQKIYKLPGAERQGLKKFKYDCRYCTERYAFKATLRIHLVRIHFNALRLKLLQIQKNPDLEALKRHAQKTGSKNPEPVAQLPSTDIRDIGIPSKLIPTLLNYTPKERASAAELQQRTVVDTNKCPTCGITVPTKSAYMKHIRLECNQNEFITTQSTPDSGLPPSKSFWRHLRAPITHRCNICRKNFPSAEMLQRHASIQHPPDFSHPNAEIECEHCMKKFRFFFSYRIHVLTTHRMEVFSSYAPAGTKNKEITIAINKILQDFKKLPNNMNKCNYCKKEFPKANEIENHIVVSHFDEIAVHFQSLFEDNKEKEHGTQDIPPATENHYGTSETFSEETTEGPERNVDEDFIKKESVEDSTLVQQVIKEEAINVRDSDSVEIALDPMFILP